MVVTGDRASRYVYMFVSCLFQTITCMTNCQGEDSILRSQANISCLYYEFTTIICTWSLEECYKIDDKNPLHIEENVHIHYSSNVKSTQYCYRDKQLYLQCVCLQSDETKCSWSHKSSQASESLSLLITISDRSTSKLISSHSKQFELLDIVKPSPVNDLAVEYITNDGCLLVTWYHFKSYTDYICELTTTSKHQEKMTWTFYYLKEAPTQVFRTPICLFHQNSASLFGVRCRVMVMQTERGFWSSFSSLPIGMTVGKIIPDSFLYSVISVVLIDFAILTSLVVAVTICLRLQPATKHFDIGDLRTHTHMNKSLKKRRAISDYSSTIDRDHPPPSQLSFMVEEFKKRRVRTNHIIRIERDYKNYTDTYPGEIRAIRMTRESITSQNATLIDNYVGMLLDVNILPTNKDIQTINKCFGRQSQKMKTLCKQICGVIKRKMYKDTATDIWPAWNPKSDQIVFVVESKKITKISSTSDHTDLEIIEYERNCSAFEKESHMVMEKEKELLTTQTYDDIGRLQNLQKKVSRYSKKLMDKHKNITAIFPSIVRSVGYLNSGKHRLIERLCISIRVEKKVSGLIPLAEESIATNVGRFPTDVIAGDFCFLGDRPNDFHENIKIGSAIHAGLETDKGEMLGGTMGCFVKHKIFGMCCLTSAHVVLSQAEIQEVLKDGYHEYDRNSLKPVYQPISKKLSQFGQVVAAACNEGQSDTPGVEVALIQILCRQPTSGSFPLTDSKTKHTFAFNSGNIADAKLVRPLTEVFKFGIETGPTFGLLGIPGVSVRYRGGLRLENQLVVMPKKDAVFAKNGDSGSPAFIGISCPGTEAAIGLVSGGFDSGQVLVTPIHAALKAVHCPPYLHRFEDADSGFNDDISEGCENMDCS